MEHVLPLILVFLKRIINLLKLSWKLAKDYVA